MNFEVTQSSHKKLERRIERLKTVDGRLLSSVVKQFLNFLENDPVLSGILQEFKSKFAEISPQLDIGEIDSNTLRNIGFEDDLYCLAWKVICELRNEVFGSSDMYFKFCGNTIDSSVDGQNRGREYLFNQLIRPFCEYFVEQLDNQQNVLSFIQRYKHRSEWFRQSQLRKIHDDEMEKKQDGEKERAFVEDRLVSDLYSYLYDEGLNFHISPSSITGRIDLIEEGKRPLLEAQLASSHRLLADAKVFDGNSRHASYIGKGFGQILSYCKKYNESFGYLVIYNISEKDLEFELENTLNGNPIYKHFGKTIVFILIDINKTKADSTLGKADFYKVTKDDLLKNIGEES